MTYAFQLISPFFVTGTLALMSRFKAWRLLFRALLLIAFTTVMSCCRPIFLSMKNLDNSQRKIANTDDVYASTLVLREVIAKGDPIYLSGATRYISFGTDKPAFFAKSDPHKTVTAWWERYVENVQEKIKNQEFDLLLIDMWMPLPNSQKDVRVDTQSLISQFYKVSDDLQLPFMRKRGGGDFDLRIWTPITPPATDNKAYEAD